jgi:hypothetical protein
MAAARKSDGSAKVAEPYGKFGGDFSSVRS